MYRYLIDPGIGMKPLKQCLAEASPKAFIGVTKAQFARKVLGWAKESCEQVITAGPKLGLGGINLKGLRKLGSRSSGEMLHVPDPQDMAAILFTSGSTGLPKGVVYRHRHFSAQVEMLKNAFGIQAGEVSLPTFPPFALFDPALGMTTVVPQMDPTRPAKANPELLVKAINDFKVTNIFGSPALLDTLSRYVVEAWQTPGERHPRNFRGSGGTHPHHQAHGEGHCTRMPRSTRHTVQPNACRSAASRPGR